MSILTHAGILALLVVDLIFGGSLVDRFGGRWATSAFEFALILGYILLVLQLMPWRPSDER
jgi:nitrate/nitrite transporter NarK